MIETNEALPGRSQPVLLSPKDHAVLGTPIAGAVPQGFAEIYFGMGCFWGAEKKFWQLPGVYTTAVGYSGGTTSHPSYRDVCGGRTGHAEVVRVVFDPARVTYTQLLKTFWENHDPTQGMRQGNDVGTQYRSAIYTHSDAQREAAEASLADYQAALGRHGYGPITTEVRDAPPFY